MSTLNIIIKQEYFDEILSGNKKTEYREVKDFWTSRLYDEKGKPRKYDRILFRAGYDPGVPEMVVEFKGIKKVKNLYHIKLGKILSHREKAIQKKRTVKQATPASKLISNSYTEPDVYIQYHNADLLGYPFTKNGKGFMYD